MNPEKITTTLIIIILANMPGIGYAEGLTPKATAKLEDRMKDEKKQDEENARDYANEVKVARFDSVWRIPTTEDINVIQAGENSSKPFKAIAFLTFECAAHEEAKAVAGIIAKSKDLGSDGVVMIPFHAPNSNQAINNIFSPNDRRVFRANAIIYLPSK